MKKKKPVIDADNIPTKKSPFINLFILFTALHYWSAPDWLLYGFPVLILIVWGAAMRSEKEINLFETDEEIKDTIKKKSVFQQRLEEMAKERGIGKS